MNCLRSYTLIVLLYFHLPLLYISIWDHSGDWKKDVTRYGYKRRNGLHMKGGRCNTFQGSVLEILTWYCLLSEMLKQEKHESLNNTINFLYLTAPEIFRRFFFTSLHRLPTILPYISFLV